jgi:Bacteriophage probable baseplate hub protein
MAEPALQTERSAPSFKIFADGSELPLETALDVHEVKVSDYVEGAGAFTLAFNNWDAERQEFKSIGVSKLTEGTEVDVRAGFNDGVNSLMIGEVTSLEPEFTENQAPMMKVHGYDRLHRFRRGRKTRSFLEMKDSDIAQQIAGELQLGADAEDSQITHEYVLQSNQSDIDFLLERARRINYEVVVKDKTLFFRKAANDKSKVVSIEYGLTLKSFFPRLSTMKQVSEVVVQGWNHKTKEAIVGRAQQGDELSKMNGQKLGVAISESAFAAATNIVVDKPVFSQGEANQMAKGLFNEMTVDFITGEGSAIGNTDIRAGQVVELLKLGERFSGPYYVTSSTHIIDRKGYVTRFTVARNAT